MPTMPRPSKKAKEIHKNVMPFQNDEEEDEKKRQEEQREKNREMDFNIRQSMTR